MSIDIDQLRQRIDGEHRKAMDALEVLKSYLTDEQGQPQGVTANGKQNDRQLAKPSGGSIRAKVLSAMMDDFLPIVEIAAKSGLEVRQVRGVVNAPSLVKYLEKRTIGGQLKIKYIGKSGTES